MLNELRIKNSINLITPVLIFAITLHVWTNEMIWWFILHDKFFSHEISEFYWYAKYLQDYLLSNPVGFDWLSIDVNRIDVVPIDFPGMCFEKLNCIRIWNEI